MPSDPAPAATPAPTVIMTPRRHPGTFCGTDDVVEEWLAIYERVSENNRCDYICMRANIIFYLTGTAHVWFETQEVDLTT